MESKREDRVAGPHNHGSNIEGDREEGDGCREEGDGSREVVQRPTKDTGRRTW